MTNIRKEMPSDMIFELAFDHCVEKNGKAIFTENKNFVKSNYPTTVTSTTIDKNGKKVNTHNPYKNEVAEVQIINSERKDEVNKDAYIAELEKLVSKKKCEQLKAQCMEKREGSITVNVKPTKEFEVMVKEELSKALPKVAERVAKRCGYENADIEEVRQTLFNTIKGQQAN